MFYKMDPIDIIAKIEKTVDVQKVIIQNKQFILISGVYPSQQFRTTNFLLSNLLPKVKNKTICDMGCGLGIVGFYSLFHGAKNVSMADINPNAIKNAAINREHFSYTEAQASIYLSDCFDNFPKKTFDLIVFNIPFHSEDHVFNDCLEYALFDPGFRTLKKFLSQMRNFSHAKTEIIIAFSNKGDVNTLEKIFKEFDVNWILWKTINTNEKYDNRLYLLKL